MHFLGVEDQRMHYETVKSVKKDCSRKTNMLEVHKGVQLKLLMLLVALCDYMHVLSVCVCVCLSGSIS